MKKNNIYPGQKFGKLTVKESLKNDNGRKMWLCRCDCGNYTKVYPYKLTSNHTKSCGCLKRKYNIINKRIFNIWENMIARCSNPNRKDFKWYGQKGICVCAEWKNSFELFQNWALNNGYDDELTLDRIDSNGNYKPSNCRWVTIEEQQRNKSNNNLIEYNGKKKTVAEWSRTTGIPVGTIRSRIKANYSIERILETKESRGKRK